MPCYFILKKLAFQGRTRSRKKFRAVYSDNAPELKIILPQWEREDEVCAQLIAVASPHQNGVVERSIQTAGNAMRVMLDSHELPLEFWDKAIEFDAFIRNRLPIGPKINGEVTCPPQVYTGQKP